MEKPMTKEIAIKMLSSNEESLKDLALLHYPELGDVKQRIQTVEDAYKELGMEMKFPDGLTESEIAYRKICVLVKAFNEGWCPSFEEGTYKYFPVFDTRGKQALLDVYCCRSVTGVPAPTLFKNKELCMHVATKFIDLYMTWLSKP